jgi:hypothetical protein
MVVKLRKPRVCHVDEFNLIFLKFNVIALNCHANQHNLVTM